MWNWSHLNQLCRFRALPCNDAASALAGAWRYTRCLSPSSAAHTCQWTAHGTPTWPPLYVNIGTYYYFKTYVTPYNSQSWVLPNFFPSPLGYLGVQSLEPPRPFANSGRVFVRIHGTWWTRIRWTSSRCRGSRRNTGRRDNLCVIYIHMHRHTSIQFHTIPYIHM